MRRTLARIEKQLEMTKKHRSIRFFDSQKEYDQAKGNIKENDICFIDDLQDDEDLIKKGYLKIH